MGRRGAGGLPLARGSGRAAPTANPQPLAALPKPQHLKRKKPQAARPGARAAYVRRVWKSASYIFEDAPAVYVNEEGLLGASIDTANRAIYATRRMAEMGYLSQMDYSRVVEEGELYSIVFGDMVCVGFDPETGEDRDITDAEAERVMNRFGSDESIVSGGCELVRMMLRRRAAG